MIFNSDPPISTSQAKGLHVCSAVYSLTENAWLWYNLCQKWRFLIQRGTPDLLVFSYKVSFCLIPRQKGPSTAVSSSKECKFCSSRQVTYLGINLTFYKLVGRGETYSSWFRTCAWAFLGALPHVLGTNKDSGKVRFTSFPEGALGIGVCLSVGKQWFSLLLSEL